MSFFAHAVEAPAGFIAETLATNLNAATALTVAPDGRVFIADQTGPVRMWKNDRLLPVPALDLSDRLDTWWERGLVGVTLHPDFPRTPHLFVVYVAKQPFTHHVISRFTMLGDRADPASERVLLEGDDEKLFGGSQPAGHQGGPIRFGPDGKLYVALGEQTAGALSQSLNALQGKILRLNADGTIPEDNPFYTQTAGKYRAIWALGLRNPFGLAFQPDTGRLFETDVGQTSWEEINEIVRGGNYGWPLAEGMSMNAAFKNPLHAYPPVIGRSIVGAAFAPELVAADVRRLTSTSTSTGATAKQIEPPHVGFYAEPWRGKFFFADWAANWVKAIDSANPTNVTTFAKGLNNPVALEFAPDGSLLVLNRGTIWRDGKKWQPNTGSLVRIRHVGASGAVSLTKAPPVPKRLSETGVFASLAELRPRDGFVVFEINAPPWQPGVRGRRWISLPPGKAIKFSADGDWEFPAGTVMVQHYELDPAGVPFETHLMWFTGPRLCRAAAYRWTPDACDAALVEDGEIVPVPGPPKRHWFSPGVEEQLNLDFVVTGFLLPVNTRQLNRDRQLQSWNERGWFAPKLRAGDFASLPRLAPLDDQAASLELRARSYLDVNCAGCHRPGGPSRGNYDARFTTPLAEQKLLHGELVAGDLGIAGAQVIVPGSPEKSVLYQRLKRNDFFRMPPVSVNDEVQPVLPVLGEWIQSLAPSAANR